LLGQGPRLIKKNLPGRGLTKFEKHWSSAPGEGLNYRPKHVEMIEIVNKIITIVSSWLFILL